ncbi:DUF4190 domain-containing protein [Leifsonia sp. NPDC077715]|uniref:DUF4190 domain-containing protein n=1 Tax=Leifsonia sp. NPDC077715 TaxID=3155539 RepID=UPI0034171236
MTSVPPAPEQSTVPPAPGYGAPAYPAAPPQANLSTNTLAIVAFVCSFVVALAGIICGHIALSQIKRTGEGGRGLALAAVIIGYCSLGLSAICGFFVVVALAAAASAGYYG